LSGLERRELPLGELIALLHIQNGEPPKIPERFKATGLYMQQTQPF
jgi:hypothetical protein